MSRQTKELHRNEQGLVSFVVTIVIMIVITLIVIAFAQIARREQRQALDRQLSAQALYAAEIGVDAALASTSVADKTDCRPDINYPDNPVVDAATGTEYTCLLVDASPPSYVNDNVGTNASTDFFFDVQSGENPSGTDVEELIFHWQESRPPQDTNPYQFVGCPSVGTFPAESAWPANCDAGVLRVEIVPLTSFRRQDLINNTRVFFLYPESGGGTMSYGTPTGGMDGARCNFAGSTLLCRMRITDLPGGNRYHVRMRSIYRSSAVVVEGRNTAGNVVNMSGAQKVIDVTGKAYDVLKRIVVRAPVESNNSGITADRSLTVGKDICKLLRTAPGTTFVDPLADATPGCSLTL